MRPTSFFQPVAFQKAFLMSSSKRDILFLLPYPLGVAPSQRFRVEAYFPVLRAAGRQYRIASFLDAGDWKVLYKKGSALRKGWAVVKGFLKRFYTTLLVAPFYDHIFVHREASPLGPPVFEWLLGKVFRKKLIYDFDDAIWIPAESAHNSMATRLKAFWKIGNICSYATKIAGGNDFLCAYARQHARRGEVIKLPTVVDTDTRYNQLKDQYVGELNVGWTGSHSTLPYLNTVLPVLQKLQKEFTFTFVIIADKDPLLELSNYRFILWNAKTEIEDLLQIHIGIMPLTPDPWSEGKCGFKLIQYGGVGIPAVASPVGVNSTIIEVGKTGFLASNDAEWEAALRALIIDANLREKMGATSRQKIVAEYSLEAHVPTFLGLFEG